MLRLVDVAREVAPRASKIYLDGLAANEDEYKRRQIDTPLRRCNLLTQIMTETGGCTIVQESGTYTTVARLMKIFGVGRHSAALTTAEAQHIISLPAAQRGPVLFDRVYGLGNPNKAHELGNTKVGDGWVFRGIGPLQSTGRGAAKRWGLACHADFESDVMLMVAPQFIMLPPLLEWTAGACNLKADHDDLIGIRRKINGGLNGIEDAQDWHDRIWRIVRNDTANDNRLESWQASNPLDTTAELQEALNQLGYRPALKTDGRYGPATRDAVRWFQGLNDLKVDGAAGPITLATLETRLASFHVPEALAA